MPVTMVLKSSHGKYLTAVDDRVSVTQERTKSSRAEWTVEFIPDSDCIRLKSCYGKYLTPTNEPFLLGLTGNKVTTMSEGHIWKPLIVESGGLILKTLCDTYLCANGGPPPWRNEVTHDDPLITSRCVWDVYVTENSAGSLSRIKTTSRPQLEEQDSNDSEKYIEAARFVQHSSHFIHHVINHYGPQIAAAMQNSSACTIL